MKILRQVCHYFFKTLISLSLILISPVYSQNECDLIISQSGDDDKEPDSECGYHEDEQSVDFSRKQPKEGDPSDKDKDAGKGDKSSGGEDDWASFEQEMAAHRPDWTPERIHNSLGDLKNDFQNLRDKKWDAMFKWTQNPPPSTNEKVWLNETKKILSDIRKEITDEIQNVKNNYRNITYDLNYEINERKREEIQKIRTVYRIYARGISYKIANNINKEIENILSQPSYSMENKIDRIDTFIKKAESQVRDITQNPKYKPDSFSAEEIESFLTDEDKQVLLHSTERIIYKHTKDFLKKQLLQSGENKLKTHLEALAQQTDRSIQDQTPLDELSLISEELVSLYDQKIDRPVHEILKSKYSRAELAVLDDEKLNEPQEEPYVFISPEGEFLDKLQTLYTKLRQANPWHEQGLRAREVGLFAVETADEEFSEGNEDSAEAAYQIGETMADIALGVLPYIGAGKDAYELFTGLHLLTGRKLSPFERAMAMTGLTLSGLSGGTLSSGAIKLSLKKSGRVITQINNKLSSRTLKGMGAGVRRMAEDYPQAFFRALEGAQFQTKEQMQAALQFLKRAFSGENPSIESFTGALASAGKSGLEDFSKALDELSAFKPKLPIAGEEFLARSLRFKRELSNQIRYTVNKESLIAAGKIYARIFRSMKEVTGQVFEGQVWRGARTEYMKNPNNVFQFHKGMDSRIARYTIAERAVYTSLKEETTIKELAQQADVPLSEVRKLFVIASKGVKTDNILDLNNPQVLKQLNISEEAIIQAVKQNPQAYELSQIIGHSAKKRGFKGIVAPSAPEGQTIGKNLILFSELP